MNKKNAGIVILIVAIVGIGFVVNKMVRNDASANTGDIRTPAALMVETQNTTEPMNQAAAPLASFGETPAHTAASSNADLKPETPAAAKKVVTKLAVEKSLANIRVSGKGNEKVVENLIVGANDSSYRVRATSVTMLGKTKSQKAIEPLIEAMLDENMVVRERAQNALKKLVGIKVPYDPKGSTRQREKAVETLREMLPDMKARLK